MISGPTNAARRRLLLFWLACAAYVVATGLVIQLFLLPRVFPSWDTGNGLLVRTDSPRFHRLAVEMADRIRDQGWSAWELRPEGQAPAGMAAIFYAVGPAQPWVLLPLNAVLHATAAVLLVAILQRLVRDDRWAMLAAVPFVIFPSALRWTAQIHKDGVTILGFTMFAYALLLVGDPSSWYPRWRRGLQALLLVFLGMGLTWAYRSYMSLMLQIVGLAAMGIVVPHLLMAARRRTIPASRAWIAAALGVGLLGATTVFSRSGIGQAGLSDDDLPPQAASSRQRVAWQTEPWMPEPLNQVLRSVANRRHGLLTGYSEAGSNIDVDVDFRSYADILAYLPRAMQIGLTAPFPSEWLAPGTLPSTTLMRRAAIPEMTIVYAAWLILPLAIWRWRRIVDLWILLVLNLGMLAGYALVVANIGTLYRMRYPFVMLLVGISLAAVAAWLDERTRKRKTLPVNLPGPTASGPISAAHDAGREA